MAKVNEEASATVTMNMEPARKSFEEWTAAVEKGKKKLEELLALPQEKQKPSQIAKLKEEIAHATNEAEKAEKKLKTFRDTLSNINGSSFNDLYKASRELEAQIKKLVPGTKEYIAASADLKKVNTRIKDMRDGWRAVSEETGRASSLMNKLSKSFQKYWSMFDVAMRTLTGLSMKFRQCAEDAAKLDDVFSDVMKTTGLMHDEVAALDQELMKIDPRTSREQLLLLARDAGKLGLTGKENILGFVRAADQIQVALGEDLGEGAIRNLGKIADVLGYTSSMGIEQSLLSIASAVNAVGQASTASEGYLVDFTQRLAGVAAQTNISAADIIGFASGLDQSAMKVEMAATAFQKFLMKIYEDPAKFAQYANMEVQEFTDLLANDANKAIITILKSLKDQDGFASLVPIFQDMGLDGARAVSVLAAMATNIDAVTDAQELANEEFEKATSVTEEYLVKNNNLNAQLEKARKEFHNASIALGQSLNPILLKSTKATTYMIKALAKYGKEIKAAVIAVAALTLVVKANAIAEGIRNAALKIGNALNKTGVVTSNYLKLGYYRLTGQTMKAAAAQTALNTAMSASVFGVIALAVAGLTAAITHWVKKSREANEVNEKMLEIERQADEEYTEQAARVRALTAIVENNNIALGQRKKALEDLKKIVPGYHGDLTEEGKLINSNKTAIDEYCKSLREQLRLKAREEQLMEIERQIADLETKKAEADEKAQKALEAAGGDNTRARQGFWGWKKTDYGEAMNESESMQRQIDALDKQAEKLGGRIAEESKKIEETSRTVLEEEGEKTNAILTQAQFDYLQERSDKLTKKEQEMVAKKYSALSEEESRTLAKRYAKLTAADNKASDKRYQQAVQNLERQQRAELNILNEKYFNQKITAEEHEQQLRDITMKYLQEKLQLAIDNNKDTTQIEAAIIKERMANSKADYDEALKQLQACQKDEENALAMSLANQEITEKECQAQMLEVKMRYLQEKLKLARDAGQDETEILQAILDAQLEAQKAANEEMAKLKKEAQEVIAGLDPSAARKSELQEQLDRLDVLHNAELLSEQQYEEAVKQLRKKYADEDLNEKLANVQKYVDQFNSIMSEGSNFVSALKEAETAKLEAEYQAQLTAAGDNAEKREEIEAEYEQKQLDLKKKYADTEMAINIAKTIASGAAAAIKAYQEGGPYAGVALAALIAATTAAEVATIVQQRNAIKNASVNSSGGSTSVKSGQRKMTGYAEGGYTEGHTTLTTIGEEGVEYVIPHWMVQQNPVMVANLERYRQAGSHGRSGSISRGFAEGGFTGATPTNIASAGVSKADIEAAVETAIIRSMATGALRAYVVRKDITNLDDQDKRLKDQTSR